MGFIRLFARCRRGSNEFDDGDEDIVIGVPFDDSMIYPGYPVLSDGHW